MSWDDRSGIWNISFLRSDGLSEYCIFWLQKLKNQPKNWGMFMHTVHNSALNLRHVYAHRA